MKFTKKYRRQLMLRFLGLLYLLREKYGEFDDTDELIGRWTPKEEKRFDEMLAVVIRHRLYLERV